MSVCVIVFVFAGVGSCMNTFAHALTGKNQTCTHAHAHAHTRAHLHTNTHAHTHAP